MNPSEQVPDPNQAKLLSDLIHLLERNPDALQQLKKSLETSPPTEPVPPLEAPLQATPPTRSAALPNSRPLAVVPQVPKPSTAIAQPKTPAVTQASNKAKRQIQAPVPGQELHQAGKIPVLPVDEARPVIAAKPGVWEKIGGRSLTFAALLHVAFLVIAAFWIIGIIQPPEKDVDFMPAGGGGGERGADVKVQQKKMATITPSTQVKRVFAEGANATFSLPDQGDQFGEMSPLSSLGGGGMSGGLGGSGLGSGFGKGSGSGAGSALGGAGAGKLFGPLNLFGQKGALDGIQGTFRDFKINSRKEPTGTDPSMASYVQILKAFERRGWESSRWKHYESPTKLNAKFFFFPAIEDRLAGPAFDSKDSQAGLWVAHYRGRCKASNPGNYRFVGWGDNVLAVKIGNKVVLDACDVQKGDGAGAFLDRREAVGSVSFPGKESTTIYVGEWVRFGPSEEPIEVVLGDQGGIFCAGLFIQPEGMPLTFGANGIPSIPLFIMGPLSEGEQNLLKGVPPQSLEGPIFMAKPENRVEF